MTKYLTRFFLLLLLTVTFCVSCDQPKKKSNQLQVVATTGMIADLVENIGKEFVDVTALMGPGVDPHLYRTTEGDVRRLSGADIIFYNGLHLESKMTDILEKMSAKQTVVAITKSIASIELLESEQYPGMHDPHVWFDVRLWAQTIDVVKDVLIQKDAKNKQYYIQNAAVLHGVFRKLDEDIVSIFNDSNGTSFVCFRCNMTYYKSMSSSRETAICN